jgi:histidine triad (HIT) family protein
MDWGDVADFAPLGPVVRGHRLVVPKAHVQDAAEDPAVTAETFRVAALVARQVGPCNLITSVGAEATQSVFHLHVHVVPRRLGDGLKLPWTDVSGTWGGPEWRRERDMTP